MDAFRFLKIISNKKLRPGSNLCSSSAEDTGRILSPTQETIRLGMPARSLKHSRGGRSLLATPRMSMVCFRRSYTLAHAHFITIIDRKPRCTARRLMVSPTKPVEPIMRNPDDIGFPPSPFIELAWMQEQRYKDVAQQAGSTTAVQDCTHIIAHFAFAYLKKIN